MFWWNFPISSFPPVSVPSGPPLSIPCYSFVRCGTTSPCLPHIRAHPSPHMCEWCSDGQSEYASILELWSLLHVRPYTEISPDQRGCRNAKTPQDSSSGLMIRSRYHEPLLKASPTWSTQIPAILFKEGNSPDKSLGPHFWPAAPRSEGLLDLGNALRGHLG